MIKVTLKTELVSSGIPITRKDWFVYNSIRKGLSNVRNNTGSSALFRNNISLSERSVIAKDTLASYIKEFRRALKSRSSIEYTFGSKNPRHGEFVRQYHFALLSRKADKEQIEASRKEILECYKSSKDQMKKQIQNRRKNQRQLRMRRREFRFRGIDKVQEFSVLGRRDRGYVHTRPNSIYNMFLTKTNNQVLTPKHPSTEDHYMGIELEFICKYSANELEAELIKAELSGFVHLKRDGSIENEDGYFAHELAILAKEEEVEVITSKICKLLAHAEAKVNSSCGMHVHLDARYRNQEQLFNNLVVAQPILYAMNPKSRLTGRYSKKTKTRVFRPTGNRDDRYQGINQEAFNTHRTIEVRVHSGTINETKILNWIKLLKLIANKKDTIKRVPRSFRTFVKSFEIDNDLASYIVERIQKFNAPDAESIEETV